MRNELNDCTREFYMSFVSTSRSIGVTGCMLICGRCARTRQCVRHARLRYMFIHRFRAVIDGNFYIYSINSTRCNTLIQLLTYIIDHVYCLQWTLIIHEYKIIINTIELLFTPTMEYYTMQYIQCMSYTHTFICLYINLFRKLPLFFYDETFLSMICMSNDSLHSIISNIVFSIYVSIYLFEIC